MRAVCIVGLDCAALNWLCRVKMKNVVCDCCFYSSISVYESITTHSFLDIPSTSFKRLFLLLHILGKLYNKNHIFIAFYQVHMTQPQLKIVSIGFSNTVAWFRCIRNNSHKLSQSDHQIRWITILSPIECSHIRLLLHVDVPKKNTR